MELFVTKKYTALLKLNLLLAPLAEVNAKSQQNLLHYILYMIAIFNELNYFKHVMIEITKWMQHTMSKMVPEIVLFKNFEKKPRIYYFSHSAVKKNFN